MGIKTAAYTILVLTILLGFAVRAIEVFNGNYVFGFDHGRDYLSARSIAVDHKMTLIGAEAGSGFAGVPGVFHGPGYHYMLAILLFLFNGNPYGAILALFLLSVIAVAFLYVLSRRVLGAVGAYAVAAFAALSPPLTAQARMIWAPNFSALVALPFLWSLWKVRTQSCPSVFLAVFLAASLYHFELPMAVPAIAGTVFYLFFVLRMRSPGLWASALGGIMAGFMPMIVFESRHGWRMLKGIASYRQTVGMRAVNTPFLPVAELTGDGQAWLGTIRESFALHIPGVSRIFPWLFLAGALWYVYREKDKNVRQFMMGLLLVTAAHMAVFYPYRGPLYPHYFSLLYFIYPVIAGYVLVRMLSGRVMRFVAYISGAFVLFSAIALYPSMIKRDIQDYGGTAKIRGKTDAIRTIYEDAAGEPFNLLVFTPPVYTYPYDYLLWWYGGRVYGYVPGREKKDTFYLLMEPDPDKPWSYKGWQETVIQTGTVLKRWELPSGFIIEKRIE